MSWAVGYDSKWSRDIGYGVPAFCDFPGCTEKIDRGLGYVCGWGEPYGGEEGCGLYFCSDHGGAGLCQRCSNEEAPFEPTPDHPDWINWKLTEGKMARRLAQTTAFSVESILAARATLRSFPGVTRDNFEQVTKAVLDLSAALGADLGTSVAEIGEALEEIIGDA